MATLAKEELLKYLKDAIELESSLVAQEQIRDMYKVSSDRREPKLLLEALPEVPIFKTIGTLPFTWVGYAFIIFNLISGIILMASSVFLAGLFFLTLGGVPIVMEYKSSQETKRQNEKRRTAYAKEYEMYTKRKETVNSINESIQKKYNRDYASWQSSNAKVFNYLTDKQSQTRNALNKLYAKEVIFPKYRNLPALTSIYEYILSGRCEELTGATGAYNLYEEELRKDIVIAQLNTIISNLEQIRQNQYMLYEEIKKVQRNTAVIAVELDAIRGYTAALTELTALNTFYNGIAASNSQIMAYWG